MAFESEWTGRSASKGGRKRTVDERATAVTTKCDAYLPGGFHSLTVEVWPM